MRHSPRWMVGLSLVLLGCGIDESSPLQGPEADSGTTHGDAGVTVPAPTVDPVAASVCSPTVPLQGTAMPGASVIVFGGSTSAISTDAHPTTGRFCVDVPLVPGQVNTLEVRAQDPVAGMSAPAAITVTHKEGCTDKDDDASPPPVDKPESRNVALGSVAAATKLDKGQPGLVVDGDSSTYVRMNGGTAWAAADEWIYIKLDKLYTVKKIVVRWKDRAGSGTEYATEYKLMVSDYSDPGTPKGNESNGKWHLFRHVVGGNGGTDAFYAKSGDTLLVQWVAVRPMYDAASNWTDAFRLSEIEVWDVPPVISQPPAAGQNTCATVGS